MLSPLLPLLLLFQAAGPPEVGTGPQPAMRPIAWELEFEFLDPQRIEVKLPGTERSETYWYVVYTVTNRSGRSRDFFPTFEIVTENLTVHTTDTGISPLVFDAIRERHRITHKYLVAPSKAIGLLRTGADNALESVAIWRDIDLSQNNFRIYVSGLSGETRTLANPIYDPARPESQRVAGDDGREREIVDNPRYFTLRKTLTIGYNLPGSPGARSAIVPERQAVKWIMR